MFIYSNKINSNEIKIKRNKIIDQLSGHRKYVINLENQFTIPTVTSLNTIIIICFEKIIAFAFKFYNDLINIALNNFQNM